MKKLIIFTALITFYIHSYAATVDTIVVHSKTMNKNIKAVIILPKTYNKSNLFPVVYLLHGWSDNYATWISKVPHIKTLADEFNFIIVMPDGDYDSWYWDSPKKPKSQYETFISKELIEFIDKDYKTIKSNKGRAITGNSMGGQGALFLAFRHQDVFGSAGSLSGGLDIRPFSENWGMADKIGTYEENKNRWDDYAIINQVYRISSKKLKIIIDCGTDDFFYKVNKNLHNKLLERNIPHVYIERPGEHNWNCWQEAIDYQFVFFDKYFKKQIIN